MQQFVIDTLVKAVQEAYDGGRPLPGTALGTVLREAHQRAGLPSVGKGVFKPTADDAISRGLLRRVFRAEGGGDVLIPANSPVPNGYGQRTASAAAPSLGLPLGFAILQSPIYRAFAGLDAPRYADPSAPPHLSLVSVPRAGALEVTPVAHSAVIDAWNRFAPEVGLPPDAATIVRTALEPNRAAAWGRVTIPGDSDQLRLGAKFNAKRTELVLQQVRSWASEHGLDLSKYEIAAGQLREPALASPNPPAEAGQRTATLRQRLHHAIDRMSLEQLCELRVPAEFLLG